MKQRKVCKFINWRKDNGKSKELIERGLELFSRNSVGRLEKFFESAKQENLDISSIDKKIYEI